MDRLEIKDCLNSFRIIADTREQATPAASKRFADFGVPVERATLSYCDYAANITLPDGKPLHDCGTTLTPACVIERKMSLDELAGNLTRSRDRFEREFARATASGARVFLLVEDANWESILLHRYRSKFSPEAYKASLAAWMIRYNLTPVFCRRTISGQIIREILYRDIKERLERGEYG